MDNSALNTCLVSGLPGSGKSLLLVGWLKKNAEKEKPRLVFTNLNGLKHKELNTHYLEDFTNITLDNYPPGSVFVIDEAQEEGYHPHSATAKKPPHLSMLEKHRHSGYSFIFATQHPKFLDSHVRRLCTSHYHCFRAFNRKGRTVKRWDSVNENPEPLNSDSTAQKMNLPFDKELFSLYKSSQSHTVKTQYPWRKIAGIIFAMIIAIAAIAYAVISLKSKAEPLVPKSSQSSQTSLSNEEKKKAVYSGFVLKKNEMLVDASVFFNLKDKTYTLNDFEYILDDETVKTYDERGVLFASFYVPRRVREYL